MNHIFNELEEEWGLKQDDWTLDQWREAAYLCSELATVSEETIHAQENLQETANAYIHLLKDKLEKSEALNTKLTKWLHKFIKKPVGRPFKTRQSKPFRTLGDLYQPPKRKGRPNDYQHEDKELLIAIIDNIKNEQGFKTDIAAIRYLSKSLPARQRQSEIDKYAKLLSRFRKEIAKIE